MIIDGKKIAEEIRQEVKKQIEDENLKVCLAVVIVGENPASMVYVKNKTKACEDVKIKSLVVSLNSTITQKELNKELENLSKNHEIDGILLQLPLPNHLNAREAISHINVKKDVDGLTNENIGKLLSGEEGLFPCTPLGCIELVKRVIQNLSGKNVIIVGRSLLVGKPLAQLFLKENCTVTMCHSKTKNLKTHTKKADILIAATGQPKIIKKEFVKKGAIVIDVGISRNQEGKLEGDVDFEEVKEISSHITPVPGGVGPMTIAMLLKNTLKCAKNKND